MNKSKSLTEGGLYYLIYNVLNMAFPFITGMYVSRVLLPKSIGTVAVAQNLAQYFVILAFLGIPTYGLREISKTRNNIEERNRVFSELFIINLCSTIFFLCVYIIVILVIPAYRKEIVIYLIVGISIALNAFNIEWLYEGLEEFKFTTIRSLVFKALSFCLLIILVRSNEDLLLYLLVTTIGSAGNYIVNMIFSPRLVKFSRKGLNLRRHMKSIFFLVTVNLAIELYSLVDITMMNFMCDKDSIAFYKYGSGVEKILLQIVNTFTMVLVPRISFYSKEGRVDEYNQLLSKAFDLILITAVPMIIGLYFTSDFLMVKLYGAPYIASAKVLKIISLLLLISPSGYLLGSRVMLVNGYERLMVIPVGIGALVNIICNALLIPSLAEYGAAIASVISETVVMTVYVTLSRRFFKLKGILCSIWKIFFSSLVIGVFLFFIGKMTINGWIVVSIQIVGSVAIYFSLLVLTKETIVTEYFDIVTTKIKTRIKNE